MPAIPSVAAIVVLAFQLFPPVPVPESEAIHLHIGKSGEWRLTHEASFRLRNVKKGTNRVELLDTFRDMMVEMYKSRNNVVECDVKMTGDNTGRLSLEAEGDDITDAAALVRDLLGFENCAFSWDRNTLQIDGFLETKEAGLIDAVVSAVFIGGMAKYRADVVLTTDGRFVCEHIPGKLDDDGRRVTVDFSTAAGDGATQRRLRVENIGS